MNHRYFLSVVGDVEAAREFVFLCKNEFDFANQVSREFLEPNLTKDEERRKEEIKYFKEKAIYFAEDIYRTR